MTILAMAAGTGALLWMLSGLLDVLLLGFAGLLFALFLSGCGGWLAGRLNFSERAGVALVSATAAALIALGGFMAAPAVASQANDLGRELPKAVDRASDALERYDWGQSVNDRARQLDDVLFRKETMSRAGGILSTSLGAVGGFIAIGFVGLFIAFEPGLYRRGLLRLVPRRRRQRMNEVLHETASTLRMWMVGKLVAMVVVGFLTWLGLTLLGIPLALTLALIAALLTFVPNFGPVLSAVPAILLGLLDSPSKALYVGLLYVAIQTVESYIVTPLVQKKTVSLPPALTLMGQVTMGVVAGGVGVIVATPLVAAALVVVKRLYVEDALADSFDDDPIPRGDGEGERVVTRSPSP